ncbi:MAG: cupin domain-containing protein [Eubacterium sp.]|nr:cupin domain-containing protein [Eubacterium sp.]
MKTKRLKYAVLLSAAILCTLSGCSENNLEVSEIAAVVQQDVQSDTVTTKITEESASVNSADTAAKEDLTFPIGMALNGGSFTGTAYLAPMIANEEIYNFPQTNNVTFEPKARSGWHTHGGMIILVTGGVGYYQEEGQPAQIIRKGDVIECAEGVKHWHGADPDSWFSQVVIYNSHYAGGGEEELVTDEQYENLVAVEYGGRQENNSGFMFPKAAEPMVSANFSGAAYVSSIVGGNNAAGAPDLHYVVFDESVINNWHTHAGGQILIATDGVGYHQIEGEPVQIMRAGDVAYCPPNVKHWHGAATDAEFAHIAVNTNPERQGVEWFDRISEEEYGNLNAR